MGISFGGLAGFLLLLSLSGSSCRPTQPQWEPGGKLPEGVLDREAMIALLVDIHLAEGDLLERNLPVEEQEPLLKAHYGPILSRHGITAKQLSDSYTYYVERPLTLNELYVEVIEELNRIQAQVQVDIQSDSETKSLNDNPDQGQPAPRSGPAKARPTEESTARPTETRPAEPSLTKR